eukprot:CAMPEP_0170586892 /NCGR_PEP_ID=MMETSP0224-20130122/9987_1 /TAXON_ID=285029 /ORGANISM="Togula jolla, Strain CCCM 725" /LENGTH=188 /DNA_ID=CAMNT_0010910469 /DNA_START=22 /DNA_END=588 /DNA_ORIENTATION=+
MAGSTDVLGGLEQREDLALHRAHSAAIALVSFGKVLAGDEAPEVKLDPLSGLESGAVAEVTRLLQAAREAAGSLLVAAEAGKRVRMEVNKCAESCEIRYRSLRRASESLRERVDEAGSLALALASTSDADAFSAAARKNHQDLTPRLRLETCLMAAALACAVIITVLGARVCLEHRVRQVLMEPLLKS